MSDGVMSQEEIDALVGAQPDPLEAAAAESAPEAAGPDPVGPDPAAPDPAPAVPAPAPAAAATAPAPAGPTLVVPADGSGMSEVFQRLAGLEAAVTTLQQSASGGQNDAVVQALSQQVQALTAQLNQLGQDLQNSLGFALRASFQCGSCNTQGLVGSRVSCMRCGTESWIGWSA